MIDTKSQIQELKEYQAGLKNKQTKNLNQAYHVHTAEDQRQRKNLERNQEARGRKNTLALEEQE